MGKQKDQIEYALDEIKQLKEEVAILARAVAGLIAKHAQPEDGDGS